MSAVEELTQICATLPAHKVEQLVDFALFLRTRVEPIIKEDAEAEAAWERIIADPKPRPKLEAFATRSLTEGSSKPLEGNL